MNIGISLVLVALGAILIWGVTTSVAGISINVIGVILVVAGLAGVVLSLVAAQRAPGDPRTQP
jgi:hypothetical protein